MKQFFSAFAVVLMALAMVPSTASAKDMTGRFGIGGDSTIAGVSGVSARFQIAKNFGIQAVAAFDQDSATIEVDGGDDIDLAQTRVAFAIRGDIGVAFTKQTNLSVIFGINIINESAEFGDEDRDATAFPFEFGLKAEYFFTNFFSVHTEVGVVLAFYDEENAGLVGSRSDLSGAGDSDVSGFLLGLGRTDLWGGAGFTFWFN